METGDRILYKIRDSKSKMYIKGWVSEINGNMLRLADWKYGKGSWYCKADLAINILEENHDTRPIS